MPKLRFIHADGSHRKTREFGNEVSWREAIRMTGFSRQSCSRVGCSELLNGCEDIVTHDAEVVVVGNTARVAVHHCPTGTWLQMNCHPYETMSDVYSRLQRVMDTTVEQVMPIYSNKYNCYIDIGPHAYAVSLCDFLVPLVIRIELRPVMYHTARDVQVHWPYGATEIEDAKVEDEVIVHSVASSVRPHRVRLGVLASPSPLPDRSAFMKRKKRSLLRRVLDT